MTLAAIVSTIRFWLKILVSLLYCHGRSTPIMTSGGRPGSTSVADVG